MTPIDQQGWIGAYLSYEVAEDEYEPFIDIINVTTRSRTRRPGTSFRLIIASSILHSKMNYTNHLQELREEIDYIIDNQYNFNNLNLNEKEEILNILTKDFNEEQYKSFIYEVLAVNLIRKKVNNNYNYLNALYSSNRFPNIFHRFYHINYFEREMLSGLDGTSRNERIDLDSMDYDSPRYRTLMGAHDEKFELETASSGLENIGNTNEVVESLEVTEFINDLLPLWPHDVLDLVHMPWASKTKIELNEETKREILARNSNAIFEFSPNVTIYDFEIDTENLTEIKEHFSFYNYSLYNLLKEDFKNKYGFDYYDEDRSVWEFYFRYDSITKISNRRIRTFLLYILNNHVQF